MQLEQHGQLREIQQFLDLLRDQYRVNAPIPVAAVKGKLFLSYARSDDEPFVKRLYEGLVAEGFDVWWDRVSMPNRGIPFLQEIQDAIVTADRLLLVYGPAAKMSVYVNQEWEYALSICTPVLPVVRIGEFEALPDLLQAIDARDFRKDEQFSSELAILVKQLKTSVAPLAKLVGVPSLPPNFQWRPVYLRSIKESLLANTRNPATGNLSKRFVGVQGMGGIGKSVLASAIAHDCDVRRRFPDGIFWVSLGQKPNLIARQSDLCRELGYEGQRPFEDVKSGVSRLSNLLADRKCLIILDDLWELESANAFDAVGEQSRLLITSRSSEVIDDLGARKFMIDVFSEDEALTLMARFLAEADNALEFDESKKPIAEQVKDRLPLEAKAVAQECGYLPLALALSAAQARDGSQWKSILDALQNAELDFLDRSNESVMRSIKVSLDALDNTAACRYQELVVFPEEIGIPEAAILTLWTRNNQMRPPNAEKLLITLSRRSMLRLEGQAPQRCVRLHDLQRDYLLHTLKHIDAVHREFVEVYRQICGGKWHQGPNDGYFFENLAYHLIQAGQKDELYRLLTDSPAWMEAKFDVCLSDTSTMNDLALMLRDFNDPLRSEQILPCIVLHTAKQVIHARVGLYRNSDLETLVWLGREREALAHARLRSDRQGHFEGEGTFFEDRLDGLLTIYHTIEMRGGTQIVTTDELLADALRAENKTSRAYTLQVIAQSLCKNGQLTQALEIVHSIEQVSFRASSLQEIAQSLCKNGQLTQALEIVHSIEECSFRATALSTVATVLVQASDSRAEATFSQALDTAHDIEDAFSCAGALSTVATAFVRVGDSRAEATFSQALKTAHRVGDVSQRAHALSEIANALAQADDDRAEATFSQALKTAHGVGDVTTRFHTLGSIISEFARSGKFSEALKAARRIKYASTRSNILCNIGAALAQAGDDRAEATFSQALTMAQAIREMYWRAISLCKIGTALAQAGDNRTKAIFGQALETATHIEDVSDRMRALRNIATALAQTGDDRAEPIFGQVLTTARDIMSVSEYTQSLTDIAANLVQINDSHAESVFSQALKTASSIEETSDRIRALSQITIALTQAGDSRAEATFSQALEIAQVDKQLSGGRNLYDIVKSLAQAGQLSQALIATQAIRDIYWQVVALCEIASALGQAGDSRAGIILRQVLETSHRIREMSLHNSALEIISKALAQAGQLSQALQIAHRIKDVRYRADALGTLAKALAQAGQLSQALEIARNIQDEHYCAVALCDIATVLAEIHDCRAETTFDQALAAANRIEHTSSRAIALHKIVIALITVNDSRAEATFTQLLATANRIDDDIFQSRVLRDIVISLAKAGKLSQALQIAPSITFPSMRADALKNIANTLVEMGHFVDALTVLGEREPEDYLGAVATYLPSVNQVKDGLAIKALCEAVRIMTWFRPSWDYVIELLTTENP